jgi:hypothetical protein
MRAYELKRALNEGALDKYSALYSNIAEEAKRFCAAIDSFVNKYGDGRDIFVFSVPGRSEIIGNHTDHNCGKVMAGAITKDIIAVAAKNNDGAIRFYSEGYPEDTLRISDVGSPNSFRKFTYDTPNAYYYFVDLFCTTPDNGDLRIPDGTYTLDLGNTGRGNKFMQGYSIYRINDTTYGIKICPMGTCGAPF